MLLHTCVEARWLFGGDLGDGGAGGGLVDARLLVGEGGEERLDGGLLSAGDAAAGLAEERGGVVGEAPSEFVAEVRAGLRALVSVSISA